ncbi:MAG: hypothetical protein JW731_04630 [Bacteroidales bacterium]|nr:hypothetical protein [Bacteroidales bacterium]
MNHFTSPSFWELYEKLPKNLQLLAVHSFNKLKSNENHPSLHLKKVGKYWSVRIGKKYRALGVNVNEGVLWFWIGSHAEYDRLIK